MTRDGGTTAPYKLNQRLNRLKLLTREVAPTGAFSRRTVLIFFLPGSDFGVVVLAAGPNTGDEASDEIQDTVDVFFLLG